MFSFHDFIMKGLLGAIGRQADYWVINQAAGWQQKGVLEMEDLAQIDEAINAQYISVEPEPDPTVEELVPDGSDPA